MCWPGSDTSTTGMPMTVALLDRTRDPASKGLPGLRLMVLARIACEEGASRAELMREIGPLLGSDTASRLPVEAELAQLIRGALAIEHKSRFSASSAGVDVLMDELGLKTLPRTWGELRDMRLVAKVLGIEREGVLRLKGLLRPDDLRAEVLISNYGLSLKGSASASRLRAALSLVALERAFGNKIKGELSSSTGFNAKAARVLAGQLLKRPRDAGTDKRLVALLAAEVVGSVKIDGEAVRFALLRRLAGGSAKPQFVYRETAAGAVPRSDSEPARGAAKQTVGGAGAMPASQPAAPAPAQRPAAAARPDLPGFVRTVQQAAAAKAEGWPGNRKALISRVFGVIASAHPNWGLSLVEFKAMLAECHRIGHVVLTTADLKDKRQLDELRQSAISYKNTVWHLVRVED